MRHPGRAISPKARKGMQEISERLMNDSSGLVPYSCPVLTHANRPAA
jgi:hypothetical protein